MKLPKIIVILSICLFLSSCVQPVEKQKTIEKEVQTIDIEEANIIVPTIETPTTPQINSESTNSKEFIIEAKQWEFIPSSIIVNQGDSVTLIIKSTDVAHAISIPAFNINSHLSPGKTVTLKFIANKTGTFTFFCSKYCGSGHSSMKGSITVK